MASDTETAAPAPAQVCGEFHDRTKLDTAMSKLEGDSFQRADLAIRTPSDDVPGAVGDSTPVREDDARNLRQLGVSTAAAAVGMAAAGLVVATGGAALPAIAAAVAAGGGTAAAGEALGEALAPGGKAEPQQAAESGGVILLAHAASPELRAKAEQIMRESGATRVWVEGA